jgi:hypothetical protein
VPNIAFFFQFFETEATKGTQVPYLAAHLITPCFSIYFSSPNPSKYTERSAELLPIHSKANTRVKTSIYFYLMKLNVHKSTANLKLIDSPMISLTYQFLWLGVLTDLTIESGSFWFEAEIDCVLSVTEWSVSNVVTRFLIRMYKFRSSNKTIPPLRVFVSRNPV